jgi:hypothetical protein
MLPRCLAAQNIGSAADQVRSVKPLMRSHAVQDGFLGVVFGLLGPDHYYPLCVALITSLRRAMVPPFLQPDRAPSPSAFSSAEPQADRLLARGSKVSDTPGRLITTVHWTALGKDRIYCDHHLQKTPCPALA